MGVAPVAISSPHQTAFATSQTMFAASQPAFLVSQAMTSAASCKALYDSGVRSSGLYKINANGKSSPFEAYCDMENDGGGWTLVSNFRDTSRNCLPNAVGTLTSPRQTSHARLSDDVIRNLQGDSSGHFRWVRYDTDDKLFWRYREGAQNRLFYSKKAHSGGGMESGNIHEAAASLNGPWYCGPSDTACGNADRYGLEIWNPNVGTEFSWCHGDGDLNYANGKVNSYDAALWVRNTPINNPTNAETTSELSQWSQHESRMFYIPCSSIRSYRYYKLSGESAWLTDFLQVSQLRATCGRG